MMRIELGLSLILDVSKPVSAMERETLINVLESAEDYRATRGIMSSPDIDRARIMLNSHPGIETRALPALRDVAREVVIAALRRHRGNRTHAAREIGVTVRAMRNIIRREGVDVPAGYCMHDEAGNPL